MLSSIKKMFDFEILSYNVRRLGDEGKMERFFVVLKDIHQGNQSFFLQQTQSTKAVERLWKYQ